jgi:hypothetical protein
MKQITMCHDGKGFYTSSVPDVFICADGLRKYVRLPKRTPATLVAVFTKKTGGPDSFQFTAEGEIVGITEGWETAPEGEVDYLICSTCFTLQGLYDQGYRYVRVEY